MDDVVPKTKKRALKLCFSTVYCLDSCTERLTSSLF